MALHEMQERILLGVVGIGFAAIALGGCGDGSSSSITKFE